MKVTPQELQIRLNWPLDMKLEWFANRYADFMIEMDGVCYTAFSGGKDSDIGCRLIDMIHDGTLKHLLPPPKYRKLMKYPVPPRVFNNTGLEFPEIVDHVKEFDNVITTRPKMGFTRVIKEVGVAVGSKKIARMIRELQNPHDRNVHTRQLALTGIKKDGSFSGSFKLPLKWLKLIDAPFKVSDLCCDILKKKPVAEYEKETGRRPIVFTTTDESDQRKVSYYITGCNSFEKGKERSKPLSIFKEQDIWDIAERFQIRFAEVYYDRTVQVEQLDGSFKEEFLEKEVRTGCTFCMFGVHLEDKTKNNRIQRLAISHPKFYDIVVNKCGLGDVLSWLKLPYRPKVSCGKQTTMFRNI